MQWLIVAVFAQVENCQTQFLRLSILFHKKRQPKKSEHQQMNQLVNRIKSIKSNYPAECGNERKCGCFFTTLDKQYTIESEKEDERKSVCLNQSQKFATTKNAN